MKPLLWICIDGAEAYDHFPERLSKQADKRGILHEILYAEGFKMVNGKFLYRNNEIKKLPDFALIRSVNPVFNKLLGAQDGVRLINSIKALTNTGNKLRCHRLLEKVGIPQPKFFHTPDPISYEDVVKEVGSPFVAKNRFGHGGSQVWLIHNQAEFEVALKAEKIYDLLFQEYIKESFGKDVRVMVFGGKIIASFMRVNPSDFRSNGDLGAGVTVCEIPKEIQDRAIKIAAIVDGEILSVDFLLCNDKYIFCESNVVAGFSLGELINCPMPELAIDYVHQVIKKEWGKK